MKDNIEMVETQSNDSEPTSEARGNWGRKMDFLLSLTGYAVGLGNLWRFPYLCMRNGGGAFLIPYFTFLVLCGIPLFFLELSVGQFSSLSPLSMWKVCPLFKGLGFAMVAVSGIVCIYYNVIMAWALYYMFHSFTTGELPWATCDNWWNTPQCQRRTHTDLGFNATTNATVNFSALANATVNFTSATEGSSLASIAVNVTKNISTPAEEFWHYNVLQISDGMENLGGIRWELFGCLVLAWMIVFGCLFKGVQSSGKVVYVTATMPYLMLIVLFVRGVTLPGAIEGIKYYITPDFERLLDFKVWGEACAQIFYSLGPAYGGLITMASYNKFNSNCYRDSIMIPLVNCGTSFFSGFVVFSIVGFMATNAGLPVSEVITSGPGLAFVVYPEAITLLPFAPIWAVVFFMMLVIIGLDTQFGMFETMISGFTDEFPRIFKGKKTLFTATMCVFEFLIGIPLITKGGVYLFQIFDWYAATFSLMTISFLECIVLGWIYGGSRVFSDIHLMLGRYPATWFKICWMGITPLILLCVLVFTIVVFTPPSYGTYEYPWYGILIGWVLALCSLAFIPGVMLGNLYHAEGPITQRFCDLLKPTKDWGPADMTNRKGSRYADTVDDGPQKIPLV